MKKIKLHLSFLALCCASFAISVNAAFALDYPNKPIHIIVSYSPGGPADIRARLIGQKLSERLGQEFVVENKPGADGALGAERASRATPDGYTLFLGEAGVMAITPTLYKHVNYDPVKDFAPVTQLTASPLVLFVNTSLPAKTLKELIEFVKSNPGKLNFASATSQLYLIGELFKLRTGTNMVHIPYKGSAPAMASVISGETSMFFNSIISPLPQVKAGRLRAIAICDDKRSRSLPDVPTTSESGLNFIAITWSGVLAPPGTPKGIIDRLRAEIASILKDPGVKDRFSRLGDEVIGNTPQEFAEFIKAEYAKYFNVIKEANVPRI